MRGMKSGFLIVRDEAWSLLSASGETLSGGLVTGSACASFGVLGPSGAAGQILGLLLGSPK